MAQLPPSKTLPSHPAASFNDDTGAQSRANRPSRSHIRPYSTDEQTQKIDSQDPIIYELDSMLEESRGSLEESILTVLLQPEPRPISQAQLVVEVKGYYGLSTLLMISFLRYTSGIYAGLVSVEAKCIDITEKNPISEEPESHRRQKFSSEQWRALIALHKTLLVEHHDFFLASQHPAAPLALRQLAKQYAMPTRLWQYGILSLLDVLRHSTSGSVESMIGFVSHANCVLALF